MPSGYSKCMFCGKRIPSRGLKLHLLGCPKCPDDMKSMTTDTHIKDKGDRMKNRHNVNRPTVPESIPSSSLFGVGLLRPTQRDTRKNPYNIANSFIKNQIEEGSLLLNIPKLISDGRATIRRHGQLIKIEIDLAKFRNNLNMDLTHKGVD